MYICLNNKCFKKISSVFVVYRSKTLTGSLDPTHANGMDKPCTHSHDRIGVPGWAPITEALAIAKAGVVLVEIYYCCLGASVS